MTATPELSIHLVTWAAEDPGNWQYLLERARAADAAGIDRVVVSDHVVYGENLEAYRAPRARRVGGREAADRSGRVLARAADDARGRRRRHDPAPARHQHPPRRAAPPGRPREDRRHARRALGRPPRPRHRRGLAEGGVRRRGSRLRGPRPVARPHDGGLPDALARAASDVQRRPPALRRHPPGAQAGRSGRRADLGQRHRQHAGRPPDHRVRERVDPVGSGRGRPSHGHPADAGGDRRRGRRPDRAADRGHDPDEEGRRRRDRPRRHDGRRARARRDRRHRPRA